MPLDDALATLVIRPGGRWEVHPGKTFTPDDWHLVEELAVAGVRITTQENS